ncbi:hypothetical protein M3T53_03795 [Actinomyces sp. B33]|uniref:hypothetical protein n=1 Tax=Actinomyces sp. B33 TaxID=2942131 RepID=UPI00233FBC3C|nr:hypothetical protein [Actinomyces sp. B33]MDC4232835.1 hypothetical protein [Actinomyces sp. B33]
MTTTHRASIDELDPEQQERIARAPLPTAGTLRARSLIPLQLGKFAVINLRIMDIVLRERLAATARKAR